MREPKNRNLCEFVFCSNPWTVTVARANMNGGGPSWSLHFCGQHAKPYANGRDPYERHVVTLTKRL
jgi:hypothetical protein